MSQVYRVEYALACSFVLLFLLAAPLRAEQNMLDYLSPRGGSRGTTVEVTFHGRELKDPREVLFYQPGIKAIAFTAGFHFAFIEQGGTSLYPTLAQNVTSQEVLRVLLRSYP